MQQSLGKHITIFLFLVAFLVPRVVDIHALDHLSGDDEPISCELCDISVHTQQQDLFFGDTFYNKEEACQRPSASIVYSFYNTPLATILSPISVYNKPPPHILFG